MQKYIIIAFSTILVANIYSMDKTSIPGTTTEEDKIQSLINVSDRNNQTEWTPLAVQTESPQCPTIEKKHQNSKRGGSVIRRQGRESNRIPYAKRKLSFGDTE